MPFGSGTTTTALSANNSMNQLENMLSAVATAQGGMQASTALNDANSNSYNDTMTHMTNEANKNALFNAQLSIIAQEISQICDTMKHLVKNMTDASKAPS